MSMERTPAGPRIYVPITIPDHASQPTYAVLEFVGFSSPAPPSHTPHPLHSPAPPMSFPAPAMLCLPSPAPQSSSPAPSPSSFFPLHVTPPVRHNLAAHNALIPTSPPALLPISHNHDTTNTLYLPPSSHFLPCPHYHQPTSTGAYPASMRLEVVNLDSPPSSPSSIAPSSASSGSRESFKERHSYASTTPSMTTTHVVSTMGNVSSANSVGLSKPMVGYNSSPHDASLTLANGSSPRHMVNLSGSSDGAPTCGLSIPMANLGSTRKDEIMQTQISVSQTDRETIVHTHSSNFRDVVRQLTGASSDDQDLMPVTLPARLANRMNNANMVQNSNASTEIATSIAGMSSGVQSGGGGLGKEQLGLRRAPLKLHERRKSTMKNLEKITTTYSSHGVVTEVSPIMNPSPVTPLASDFEKFCNASTPTSQGSSGISSPINLMSKGKVAIEATAAGRGEVTQQENGGFFLQRPPASARPPLSPLEKSATVTPTLLSLFPESPACSPRDR